MHELPPILVLEDDDDDFFLFRRAARAAGIESPLLRFRDGDEFVTFVKKNHGQQEQPSTPTLLFVDLTMPMMNGFEVLEWLRKEGVKQYTPMVLSGSRREDDLKRAYSLGAEEYLVKPISPILFAAIAARPARAA